MRIFPPIAFFPTALESSTSPWTSLLFEPLRRLQCQTAGCLKTQEHVFVFCFVFFFSHQLFLWPHVGLTASLSQPAATLHFTFYIFLFFCLWQKNKTKRGDCSFKNLTWMFSPSDVTFCQSTTGSKRLSIFSNKQERQHQAYSNFWLEFRNIYMYCVSHCIWIYNLFFTCRLNY